MDGGSSLRLGGLARGFQISAYGAFKIPDSRFPIQHYLLWLKAENGLSLKLKGFKVLFISLLFFPFAFQLSGPDRLCQNAAASSNTCFALMSLNNSSRIAI
jgi:hypothetical protein